jgi:DNA repair protein RadD
MATILREYQQDIKRKVYDAWESGHKNVLLVMPTGAGKTRTFCSVTIDKAIAAVLQPRLPTAILVHRKELLSQICLTLAEEGINHNIIATKDVIKGITAAQRLQFKRAFYDCNSPVAVISVDTLNARILQHEKWAKSIKMWICDEAAHLLKDNKWGRAVDYFKDAIGLGVTATPERLDKRGLGSHADGVFDVMVEGPTTRWLIKEGFLCNYRIAVPQSDYEQYLRQASDGHDFTRESMANAAALSRIVGDIVDNYVKFANGKQAIVFSSDINSGGRTEAEFNRRGIRAKLLTGNTPDKERLDALIAYRNKEINVLLNVDLFDEGLDVPGIECVIMARPTWSLGKFLQMIGRGLRVQKGKEFCIIIDHVGNVKRHGLPCQPRRWTLDRIIRRRDKVNLIRFCQNVACNQPFDRLQTECPYCGAHVIPTRAGGGGGKPTPEEVDGDLVLLDVETLREMEAKVFLEDPAVIAAKVARAAGPLAGKKALKDALKRKETQLELGTVIAIWAGRQKNLHLTDRMINKKFYLEFGMTVTEALSEPTARMLETMEEVRGHKW